MEELIYTIVKDLLNGLFEYIRQKKLTRDQEEFLIDVLLDIIRVNATTRFYIQINGGVFRGSVEIMNQFLQLHDKMVNANRIVDDLFPKHLLDWMLTKSNFWDIPEVYSRDPRLLATIPTLDDIDNVCKEIIVTLNP